MFEPLFGGVVARLGRADFRGAQPLVEVADRGFQPHDRAGCAGFGFLQALDDARHHAVDHHLRRSEVRLVDAADPLGESTQFGADLDQGLAGAGLGVVEVGRDLAERCFQGAQGFHRAGLDRGLLDLGQAFLALGLGVLHVLEGAFEPGGDGDLVALGGLQPRQQAMNGLIDAADGQCGSVLGRLHADAQPVHGLAQTVEFLAGDGRRCGGDGRSRSRAGLLPGIIQDDTVQPVPKRKTRSACKILGDLARFGVDPLHAPRRARTHPNRSPDVRKTLTTHA